MSMDEAKKIVRRAFELGVNYFDTAKLDVDSEEKRAQRLVYAYERLRVWQSFTITSYWFFSKTAARYPMPNGVKGGF